MLLIQPNQLETLSSLFSSKDGYEWNMFFWICFFFWQKIRGSVLNRFLISYTKGTVEETLDI